MEDYKLEVVVDGVRYVREDLSDSEYSKWRERIYELGRRKGREELQDELKNLLGMEI